MAFEFKNPRKTVRDAVKASIPPALWEQNCNFVDRMIQKTRAHRIYAHPIIKDLNTLKLNAETTRYFHLEFGYAFAQIFVDSLMHAMAHCASLEEPYGPAAKVSARFLLQLNVLDELGFIPSKTPDGWYGNPFASHYMEFMRTCDMLGADEKYRKTYVPSAQAEVSRRTFTDQYQDYELAISVLAAAEQVFANYAGPWAGCVARSSTLNTQTGYHKIHVEDEHGHSLDDDHSEDSWTLLRQGVTPHRYAEIEKKMTYWMDCWASHGDMLQKIVQAGAVK